MKKWYKLDNAAKIFPSISSNRRSSLFRLSFTLKDEIVPDVLYQSLQNTIKRFPAMKVRLKKGLFWYYLEPNNEDPLIYEENPYVCNRFNFKENNGYLFKVSYYHERITIEVFHALTDGGGALEFLKALVYNYLILLGYEIDSENLILTEIENVNEEYQDSFLQNYDKRFFRPRSEQKAIQWRGTLYRENWLALVTGIISVKEVKEVAHKYNATITEFLAACLIYSASKAKVLLEKKNKPFRLFIPVDLRRIFPSRTLRNFSLYVRASVDLSIEYTFEEILGIVKEDMKRELQEEEMLTRLAQNVRAEKNIFLRLVPLAIKELVLKIGYRAWGDNANTTSFSNIGQVKLPKAMVPYIERIEFNIGASYRSPINLGVISFEDKLAITFASAIVERDYQQQFFRLLADFGLDVLIETNELEV